MERSLPTPPREDGAKPYKKSSTSSKVVKSAQRNPHKRPSATSSHSSSSLSTPHHADGQLGDGRHKRVWKACERCRMKKTKCDGEFPCKRCKDDGLVCTAGTRKKTEYKQLPKGYAEVLENTQFALIATVHKLYGMLRASQPWELGEPQLNDRGQPVIHDIASRLGCIRPNSDLDLPVQSIFPEDERGLAELAAQLEAQQASVPTMPTLDTRDSRCSSSVSDDHDVDHSDFEHDMHDYRRAAFGGDNCGNSIGTLSPQSLTYQDFEVSPTTQSEPLFPPQPPPPTGAYWMNGMGGAVGGSMARAGINSRPTSLDLPRPTTFPTNTNPNMGMRMNKFAPPTSMQQQQQPAAAFTALSVSVDLLNQGLLESSFGTIKPHVLSCPNPDVMMGIGDPMMYSGYDAESLRI